MHILKALLLGAVQGATEFFPVSSSGHVALVVNLIGFETDLLFTIMLHMGTLASVVIYFRGELIKCLLGLCNVAADSGQSVKHSFFYGRPIADDESGKLLADSYHKIAVMLIVGMGATVLVAALLAPVAEELNDNLLCAGLGFFITALMLLVASYTKPGQKGPKEARMSDPFIIGLFQGAAVLPGVSRLAMSLSSGIYRGFSRKFARLYAFLLFVPTAAGAVIFEGIRSDWAFSSEGIAAAIAGMIASLVVGYIVIKAAMKILDRVSLRGFAAYCLCVGLLSIVIYL